MGRLILSEAGGQAPALEGEPVLVNAIKPHSLVAAADENYYRQWLELLCFQVVAYHLINTWIILEAY